VTAFSFTGSTEVTSTRPIAVRSWVPVFTRALSQRRKARVTSPAAIAESVCIGINMVAPS